MDSSQAGHEPISPPKPRPITWSQWEAVAQACSLVTPALAEVIRQFWGMPVQVAFLAANAKPHYYWQADDFHVSQLILPGVKVKGLDGDEQAMALMRLSDSACNSLLSQVLGPQPIGFFSFSRMSPLENTILNEFSRDVLSVFMKNLIKKPKPNKKTRMDLVHLVWAVQLQEAVDPLARPALKFKQPMDIGKIVLTLPVGAIKAEALKAPEPNTQAPVGDHFFYHVQTTARLFVGKTRLALSDLDHLETGDLVVFENSKADQLFLIEPHSEVHLPFSPDFAQQRQRLVVPLSQDVEMMETDQLTAARQKLWDNLMIEVDAEFAPIKLPLKQLKQMSEGLIVEMGDLIHNEICLSVEGKPLAYGELVIVGDKFGVRIKQVKDEEPPVEEPALGQAPTAAAPEPILPPPPMADEPETPAGTAEEEALEQFLNEDFDDTFDDEEDW